MAGMSTQTRYRISGMDCASCASKIDTAVRRMDGVADVSVSVTAGSLTVIHADSLTSDAIARQVSPGWATVRRLGTGGWQSRKRARGQSLFARIRNRCRAVLVALRAGETDHRLRSGARCGLCHRDCLSGRGPLAVPGCLAGRARANRSARGLRRLCRCAILH